MEEVPRRALLGSAAAVLGGGCLSGPSADTETQPRPTASTTESGPVERSLEVRNEFETEQTVSLRVVEYRSGTSGEGWDGGVQSVTATPAAEDPVERYDGDLTVAADGQSTVRDVFTLADSPRTYYLSFESGEVAKQEYTLTVEKGVGFSYLSVTLEPIPDVVIVTQ